MVVEDKVLVLSVSKQWFDMIVSGEKKEEYREIKTYWVTRLYHDEFGKLPPPLVKELTEYLIKDGNEIGFEVENNGLQVYQVPFTHVLFINGYGDDRPCVEKEIECITIGKPNKGWCPDEFLNKDCFIIKFK